MHQSLFHNGQYARHHTSLPASLRDWLMHPGSFMTRLKERGAQNPKIRVLQQGWQMPVIDERLQLKLPFRSYSWVREVLIASVDKPWMYARTIFPRQTLTGQQRQLARLKSRSLGSVLFKDPTLERTEFEFSTIQPGMKLHTKIGGIIELASVDLWARRSMFAVRGKPLLLTEVFLPEVEKLGALCV